MRIFCSRYWWKVRKATTNSCTGFYSICPACARPEPLSHCARSSTKSNCRCRCRLRAAGAVPLPMQEKHGLGQKHDAYHVHKYTDRSEEHTSELQSLMRISYAVFC